MNVKLIFSISVVFLITILEPIQSQTVFSLRQCIDSALINNLNIKEQVFAQQVLENNYRQSKYDFLPDLNASSRVSEYFGQTFNYERVRFIDERITSYSFGISTSVALFEGFRKYYTMNKRLIDAQGGKFQMDLIKNQLTLEIVNTYLTILYNQEQAQGLKQQMAVIDQQIERTKKMVEAGKIPLGELYSLLSQKAEEEAQFNRYISQITIAKIALSQQMNIQTIDFEISAPDIDSLTFQFLQENPVDHFFDEAIHFLPEIQLADNALQSAKLDLEIARSRIYPSLYLSGGMSFPYNNKALNPTTGGDYPFFDQLSDRKQTEIGITLSIPIFNKLQNRTNIQNAQLKILSSENSIQKARQQVYKSVQSAYHDVLNAQKNYQSRAEALKAAQESYRFAEQRFNSGSISATDYLVEKAKLNQSIIQLTQSKYDFLVKLKVLDFYRGIEINL